MHWLEIVSRNHKDYVQLVKSWGECDYAEDIVQEMYIRLHAYTNGDKIIKNGKVNRSFIWITLRNMFLDAQKMKSRVEVVRMGEGFECYDDEPNRDELIALDRIDKFIEEEKESWHWYDKMLFDLYSGSDMSMRDIASETNISLTSIFHTLKKCKEKLLENVGEHVDDFNNGDYERI